MKTVGISCFIKEQTQKYKKNQFENLSLADIALYSQNELNQKNYKKGYRDGVILIEIDDPSFCENFKCPLVKINKNTELVCNINKRMDNEEPYIQIRAVNGESLKTEKVEIILYRKDVLDETNEASSGQDWELIAFHAIPFGIEEMPMKPVTMMRNQLELPGGTKAYYSSEKWANSINFWQKYALKQD